MQVVFDHSEQHGPRTFSFYFKPERSLRYDAGQFVEIIMPHKNPDSRGLKRWFSLSSAPSSELLSITTRLATKPSSFKQALQNLQPGDEFQVSEPMGDFVLPIDQNIPLVFIADGIGITPFLSIARQLIFTGEKRRIRLYYVVHAINDALFKDELLMAGYDVNLILTKHATGPLLGGIKLVPETMYFVSGPESLTIKMDAELLALGVPKFQTVTDYFPGY